MGPPPESSRRARAHKGQDKEQREEIFYGSSVCQHGVLLIERDNC
jgi:hypothetical protein